MNEFQIQIPEKWMVGDDVTRGRQGKIWGGFMGRGNTLSDLSLVLLWEVNQKQFYTSVRFFFS